MNEERVKLLLKELLDEINQSEDQDEELLESARRLESDIDAEKILRELVNSLSRIGI